MARANNLAHQSAITNIPGYQRFAFLADESNGSETLKEMNFKASDQIIHISLT